MEPSLSVIWNSGTFPRNEKTIIFLHVLMFPGQHLSKRRRAEYFMALRRNVEHFKGFGSANRAALKFRCLLLTFPWEDQSRRLQSPSDFSRSDPSCADSYVFLLTLAFSAKKNPVITPAQTCGRCQSILFNLGPEWEELGIPRRDRCAVRYGGAVSLAISFCQY